MLPPVLSWRRSALLLGGALLLRLVYLVQYAQLPFLRAPIYDSVVYLRQARSIVEGRFDDAALLAFSPLYGYFLALIGGAYHVGAPVLWQLGLGVFNLYLIYRLARERHGQATGLVAALLYQGYGLLLCYETKIMSETLGLTLALGAMNLYCGQGCSRSRARDTIAAGIFVALSILCRASLLFAAPFFVLLALAPRPGATGVKLGMRRAGGVLVGLSLIFLLNGLWTRAQTGIFVPVILVAKTVQTSTAADFGDDFAAFSRGRAGGASALDVVEQAESRLRGAQSMEQTGAPRRLWGVDIAGWLRGAPRKLRHTFADTEVSYDYGYFGERSEVRVLAALPVSFGMLAALGLLGAVLVGRRDGWGRLLPYLPYLFGSLATTTLFHSSSRYRLFMVLPLIVFSAAALTEPWRESRRTVKWPAALLGAGIVLLFAVKTWTYRLHAPAGWELRVAQSATVLGDRAELTRRLTRAAQLAAQEPGTWQRITMLAEAGGVPVPRCAGNCAASDTLRTTAPEATPPLAGGHQESMR